MPAHSDDDNSSLPASVHDAYAAIRRGNFRRYWAGNLLSILGMQMQSVTVVWEVYKRTSDPFSVGLVGLVLVVPVLSLALMGGQAADRFNRRIVLSCALLLNVAASLGLAAVSFFELHIAGTYAFVFLIGVARAFQQPAKSSLLPQLVPRSIFANAVTWNLGAFQLAAALGPALGGLSLAYTGHAYVAYLLQAAAGVSFIALLSGVKLQQSAFTPEPITLRSVVEGFEFVWTKKVVLGALALDLFAVLLSEAKALLPVFATDILHVGPVGYGWLASAESIGALSMSLAMMHRPPMARAGRSLLWAVAAFGAATVAFGASRFFLLSFLALVAMGAFDCVSVIIRHTLVQVLTPDRMRGRVSAISGMFISASNELGQFESGTLARLTTPVFAVVFGGLATLAVVVWTAAANPQLRRYGRLDGHAAHEDEPSGADEPISAVDIDEAVENVPVPHDEDAKTAESAR